MTLPGHRVLLASDLTCGRGHGILVAEEIAGRARCGCPLISET